MTGPAVEAADEPSVSCPECGSDPAEVAAHRQDCPSVATCGQIGPPWIPRGQWHPDPPYGWSLAYEREHRRAEHGLDV